MTETLWLVVVLGGPLLLGALIAYALLNRRRASRGEEWARRNAVRRAYDEPETKAPAASKAETPAVRSLRAEQKSRDESGVLEEGLEETFPASDPVSATSTTTTGAPPRHP